MEVESVYIKKTRFIRNKNYDLVLPDNGNYNITKAPDKKTVYVKSNNSCITIDIATLNENDIYIDNPGGEIIIDFKGFSCIYKKEQIIKCNSLVYESIGEKEYKYKEHLRFGYYESEDIIQPENIKKLVVKNSTFTGYNVDVRGADILFINCLLSATERLTIYGSKISFIDSLLSSYEGIIIYNNENSFINSCIDCSKKLDIICDSLKFQGGKSENCHVDFSDEKIALSTNGNCNIKTKKMSLLASKLEDVHGVFEIEANEIELDEKSSISSVHGDMCINVFSLNLKNNSIIENIHEDMYINAMGSLKLDSSSYIETTNGTLNVSAKSFDLTNKYSFRSVHGSINITNLTEDDMAFYPLRKRYK